MPLDVLFPPHCLACGSLISGGVLCAHCFQGINCARTFFCGRCRNRLPNAKKICHENFPFLLGAALDYGDPKVRLLIHALKFQSVRNAALPLSSFMGAYLEKLGFDFTDFLVVPIPLGPRRRRMRGFNQSELLGGCLANRFRLPLASRALLRERNTLPQSELKGDRLRSENVRGCFRVTERETLAGKSVLLVDDVVTSGATLEEAARVLKDAGVKKIIALTAAKAG